MTWTVEIPENIELVIDRISDNNLRERILDRLEDMEFDPYQYIKPLRGVPFYSFRVDGYRGIVFLKKRKLVVMVLRLSIRNLSYRELMKLAKRRF